MNWKITPKKNYLFGFCFLLMTSSFLWETDPTPARIGFKVKIVQQLDQLIKKEYSSILTESSILATGNASAATGTTTNGPASNATGAPDGTTTEIGGSNHYLVLTLTDEIPVGEQYTIYLSGRGSAVTADVFEAPDGTTIPTSQQNSPAGFTQNGQAVGAQNVITAVTKTTQVATKYIYLDRGVAGNDIQVDAVAYSFTESGGGSSNCTGTGTVVSNVGVPNPTNADGAQDGSYASLHETNDEIILDLGEALSATTNIDIIWLRTSGSQSEIAVSSSSAAASGFAAVSGSPFTVTTQNVVLTQTVSVPAGDRYLRILSNNGFDFGVDAISFTCPASGGGGGSNTTAGNLTCSASATEISGTVFQDFGYDGLFNATDFEGIEGITVTATDSLGNSVSQTTSSTGAYTLSGLLANRTYRIEFTNIPAWAQSTFFNGDNGTTVQFVQTGNCANLSLAEPSDYCGITNPDIVIACYENGDGSNNNNVSMLRYNYNDTRIPAKFSGTAANPTDLSTIAQMGTVWGAAYYRESETVFATAFLKRHVSLGPLGLGGVYMVSPTSGYLGSFDLEGVTPANGGTAISFGSITRTTVTNQIDGGAAGNNQLSSNTGAATIDLDAFTKVGAAGMGDTDMEFDADKLWTINLNTAEAALISIDLADAANPLPTNGTQPPSAIVNRYLISSMSPPSCTNGVFRPWAIGFNKGKGYVGGVCSAENGGTRTDLKAYVLSFDPANPASGFTEELTFDLDFNREFKSDFGHEEDADWQPWADAWSDLSFNGKYAENATPIFSDIEFRENGDLVLGFMDRYSHQLGYQQYQAVSASQGNGLFDTESAGDIYHICLVNGTYIPEGGVGCPTNDNETTIGTSLTDDGISGTGEYYWEDVWRPGGNQGHGETASGALSMLKGTDFVISSALDPVEENGFGTANTQGSYKFNMSTGGRDAGYMIIDFNGTDLGKAGGLSDMVLICNPAPIEIGNFVWLDANSDGIQDAGEMALEGVRMELYDNVGNLIAFDTTNNLGQYYFSGDGTDGATWLTANTALAPTTNYYIVAGGGQYGANGINLNGADYTLTTTNTNSNNSDEIDSDGAIASAVDADFDGEPYVQITTGGPGAVNHTYDFGFKNPCLVSAPVIAVTDNNCTTGAAGSFTVTTACTSGTLEWSTDNGVTWGTSVPVYTNASAQTVVARCYLAAENCGTQSTSVTSNPTVCPCPDPNCFNISIQKN